MGSGLTLVRQREAQDCGVACIATVTGESYERVRALFPADMAGGTYHGGVRDALWALGWCGHVFYRWRQSDRAPNPWPPYGLAPLPWIVQVVTSLGAHYVVVDEERHVLCPANTVREIVWPADGPHAAVGEAQHVISVARRAGS